MHEYGFAGVRADFLLNPTYGTYGATWAHTVQERRMPMYGNTALFTTFTVYTPYVRRMPYTVRTAYKRMAQP